MEQRPREAREKEEERGRGNEIVKGMRSGAGQRAREKESEREGGREKDRASWPTWANNSSEMRVWLKGPPCP